MSSAPEAGQSVEGRALRIVTFRLPADRAALVSELRHAPEPPSERFRWIGRRLVDDPGGAEIAFVTLWDGREQMVRDLPILQRYFSPEFAAAVEAPAVDVFDCRAFGDWPRDRPPCLLRIFRGALVEGDAASFDDRAAAAYLANFERNLRCSAVAAAIDPRAGLALVTLWTNWDAVVSATGGDLRQVLPVKLPGWEAAGSATHYEVVSAT